MLFSCDTLPECSRLEFLMQADQMTAIKRSEEVEGCAEYDSNGHLNFEFVLPAF